MNMDINQKLNTQKFLQIHYKSVLNNYFCSKYLIFYLRVLYLHLKSCNQLAHGIPYYLISLIFVLYSSLYNLGQS